MAGWTFTPSGSGGFAASRTLPKSSYSDAAGTDTSLQEQTTVSVSGTAATVGGLKVVLDSGGTAQVTIALNSSGAPTMQSQAVGAQSTEALTVTLGGGFAPKAGDSIHLLRGTRIEVYVFSVLKDPAGRSVSGFFDLGKRTKIQGGFGVEGRNAAPFDSTFTNLDNAKLLSQAAVNNQDIFSLTAEIEGGFATVQSADTGVISVGFGQWTAMSDLPKMLKRVPAATFQQHLGQYGLALGTPALGTRAQARKFVPGASGAFDKAVRKLALRNSSEGSLVLNGKELVSEATRKTATDWSAKDQAVASQLGTIKTDAAAAQADIASGNAAKVAAGRTRLKALDKAVNDAWKKLAGLPGVAARAPTRTAIDARINTLVAALTTAQAAADQLLANTSSVEELRTNEWVLRFQVAGEDPTFQVAEVEEAQATIEDIDKRTFSVTNGVSVGKLLPSHRAQALLFSTFLNNPSGITKGVPRAVSAFKAEKVAAAPAGSPAKAAWNAFVWPASDARWNTLFTADAAARLEAIAEDKLLPFTFDKQRRKGILNRRFPP